MTRTIFNRRKSNLIPRPNVEIRDIGYTNTSDFAGDTISGLNSVWLRTPDFDQEVFVASNQPLLELGWYRPRIGTESSGEQKGLAFPDDPTHAAGSDQGGGAQMGGSGDTAITRRSKWDVASVPDFTHVTSARMQLEHYFKLQPVKLLTASAEPNTGWPRFSVPCPTFIPPARADKLFSVSQFDLLRTTPRYHGYQHAYFQFRFSIKDPDGTHPGDRLAGPLSKVIRVQACGADGGFPLWPGPVGYTDGRNAGHLRCFVQ